MPKFSVCIPAYKSRFLEECIGSILAQSVTDFELIILNDCSPEPVAQIAATFTDSRIRYNENEHNVGAVRLTDNWNKCLALAEGEYIVMMGDDDRMEPDYLAEFSALIAAYPELDVYHCRSLVIDDEGRPRQLTPSCPAYERVCDNIWHRLSQWRSQYISDFMYRTEALRQQGGFYALPLAWGSDDITAYIACRDKGIAHTNRPVFNYRSNSLSISSSGSDLEKMRANLGYAQWLKDFLETHVPHETERVVYATLLEQETLFMQQRKRYTMALSMRYRMASKCWLWYRHSKEFGLGLSDIVIAAVKARGLRKRLSN
ncbi:glycosyltransferase family 2 protein [Parapedobacter koreensis]|uniref:Glycosyltransferase involved in cell wall bisynthesis n=1 Tax=Parapedobacter koreensis TaxID=332977 RepID=A0A1H7U383_9SPHI|nr:glycosyltransferase [Parapedobacter koreensis]SEL91245.1 Glycosyltransferase involved in cell wall bisynthesis [Parapedobacter koreensis]